MATRTSHGDGRDLLRRIRGDIATPHVPVVALSSSREVDDIGGAHALGDAPCVVKALDYETLAEVMSGIDIRRVPLDPPPRP